MNESFHGKMIAILIHEYYEYSETYRPLVSYLADIWQEMGIDVRILRGTGEIPSGVDLLIPHIDLTVVPAGFVEYINQFPKVLNRRLTDISKRFVSTNLVSADSSYDGQVIVKTDLNYGGYPELDYAAAQGKTPMYTGDVQRPWKRVENLNPDNYPVFERAARVPSGVWGNKNLVVEKFIPEREGELYCMHVCMIMGSYCATTRLYSSVPIIKGSSIIRSEVVETPKAIDDIRATFGLDYGKLDFVINKGHIEVLDINKTPGRPPKKEDRWEIIRRMAQGVDQYI